MRVVVSQELNKECMEMLHQNYEVEVADKTNVNDYLDLMEDADALIIRVSRFDADAIKACRNLRVIGRPGVGYDSIDVKAATAAGIPIVVTPGINSNAVAEHTMALILALSRNLIFEHTGTQKGDFFYTRNHGNTFELAGKTIGIVGLGAIGSIVARMSKAFNLRILAYDPFLTKETVEERGCVYCGDLDEMIAQSDIITVHVHVTDSTREMFDLRRFKLMKPTAVFINCSRGEITKEQDLVYALNEGIIAGAGVDVYTNEPPKEGDPILTAKNIILTPHSASLVKEVSAKQQARCIEGCMAILNGNKWPEVANPDAYLHPRWNA